MQLRLGKIFSTSTCACGKPFPKNVPMVKLDIWRDKFPFFDFYAAHLKSWLEAFCQNLHFPRKEVTLCSINWGGHLWGQLLWFPQYEFLLKEFWNRKSMIKLDLLTPQDLSILSRKFVWFVRRHFFSGKVQVLTKCPQVMIWGEPHRNQRMGTSPSKWQVVQKV